MHPRGPQTSDAAGRQRRKPNQLSRIDAIWRAVSSSSMPRTSASAFDHDQTAMAASDLADAASLATCTSIG